MDDESIAVEIVDIVCSDGPGGQPGAQIFGRRIGAFGERQIDLIPPAMIAGVAAVRLLLAQGTSNTLSN